MLLDFERIAQQKIGASATERLYEKALRRAVSSNSSARLDLITVLKANFRADKLSTGRALAELSGLSLLDEIEVAKCDYLNADGTWDFTFGHRHSERVQPFKREVTLASGALLRLSDQQGRVFDEFRVCEDESFHIQGYAGVGKTFLIARLFDFLNPATALLMALIPAQVHALKARVVQFSGHDNVTAMTFGHMANLLLNRDLTRNGWRITDKQRTLPNYLVSDQQIATWLNLSGVSSLQPKEIANICRRTIYAYCQSPSKEVEAKHLPPIRTRLAEVDVAVLVEYSRLFWKEMIKPSDREIRLPIRNAHRIKFLSLRDEVVPDNYTHVIIDESHELTAPMLQILDRSPQAVISLGDEFQNLSSQAAQHGSFIRQRYITQSLRAGTQMGDVLNPLIQAHPSNVKDSFVGRAEHPTRIESYEVMAIPEKPTTILVADLWGILYWFIRLTTAKAEFQIPHSVYKDFNGFFSDLMTLQKDGIRPRHRMLFNYESWDCLLETFGGFHPLAEAQKLLEKGFTYSDFQERMATYCVPGANIYLARVEDVKNQEFNTVLISSELLRRPAEGTNYNLSAACAKLYTASSRAKHELVLPDGMNDWLKDVSRPGKIAASP
ncbi:Viral (Super1) RNA helicase family protein [Azotobacter chroococcum NCIMB 8003]|uniref:Viral (Super1) RNA helicase family protein n=1 Tax=Azotobacter chroococcum NCIMB 8003 TaxID=1328314 RepID=A0A0C4WLM9_9GAMM|nr:Viral (Super1) RNA helicase family protein [Azotobacter chroococcum NCIMB 8003]